MKDAALHAKRKRRSSLRDIKEQRKSAWYFKDIETQQN